MSGPSLPPASPVPSPAALPLRIRHVDSLRAVAAGLVVWLHYAESLAARAAPGPAFLAFLPAIPRRIDVGRIGVLIFFAVSGFVICRSFEGAPEGKARRFLIRRFCRLYPAFWVSILAAWLAWGLVGRDVDALLLAANVTMVPSLLGQGYLLGSYWTLEVELLFYGLCLALYLARCLENRLVLAGLMLGLVWLRAGLAVIVAYLALPQTLLTKELRIALLGLAVMCWGALFRLAYEKTGGFRRNVFTHGDTWLVAALFFELIDVQDSSLKWHLVGVHSGTLRPPLLAAALLIFVVWVAVLRIDNRVLTFLGVISYSIYLFHPVPMLLGVHLLEPEGTLWRRVPFWAYSAGCAGLTVALAAAVYRWVEHPAIGFGRRWAARPTSLANGGPPA